jgi:hypothetical protein
METPILSAIVLVTLLACGARDNQPPRSVITPSGSPGFVLQCEEYSDCIAEAGELCRAGYSVLDAGDTVAARNPNALQTFGSSLSEKPAPPAQIRTGYRMLVTCK